MEEKIRSIESELSIAEELSQKSESVNLSAQPKTDLELDRQATALEEQERRTRIAFLQNRQAELETEILLLRNTKFSPAGLNLERESLEKEKSCSNLHDPQEEQLKAPDMIHLMPTAK